MFAAQLLSLCVVAATVVVLAANLRVLKPMEAYLPPARTPRVSVLVPARDEQRNIEACVASLLRQDYPDFELLVLDDGSTDATPEILARLAAADRRLRILHGEPLPEGWFGKPWACAQLAEAADGELLLFTDADTTHGPHALSAAVAAQAALDADLYTALPHVSTLSWGETLVLPAIPWSTVTMVPLPLAYLMRWPWLSATNGQHMLFRRDAYVRAGGHASVRAEVVEDLELGRHVKAAGLRWRVGDGSDIVATRMYRNLPEIFSGLGKNMFAVFGYGLLSYIVAWPLFVVVYLVPTVVLVAALLHVPLPGASVPLAALTWAITALQFGAAYRRFDYQPLLALLYPVTFALIASIAAWSLVLALSGRASWKGRQLKHMPLRWL